ncbi:helix-turn-helix domain-containing protein [Nocardioides panacis]|uniref:Helix-turn-helix domain-containing protein n=1 Tax=Nocardioides panacis TaxID=2849501 RepID=A0A975T191_9ACTN|nr:helix-turn-helix domain-containing protein [Nocardioides panacis]QWZ09686.1 helix-turn-helix domain-containing protein [Nocardioides panacis]
MVARSSVRSPAALGQELARLRYDHGLTQDALADALGVTRRYVYELESGKPNLWAVRLFEVLRELGAHLEVVSAVAGDPSSGGPESTGEQVGE